MAQPTPTSTTTPTSKATTGKPPTTFTAPRLKADTDLEQVCKGKAFPAGAAFTEVKVTGKRECGETAATGEGEDFVTSFTEVGAYAEAMRKYVLG